ncbi:MAG: transglycosylase domain-containing protein [Anaerolineales bacterium]
MPIRPNVSQIVAQRKDRRKQAARRSASRLGRFGVAFLAVVLTLVGFAAIVAAYIYSTLVVDLPSLENLPLLLDAQGALRHPTRIYDRSGERLLVSFENPAAAQGEYIFYELIPQEIIDATLSNSDPNFWTHPGFDTQSGKDSLAVRLVSELLLWGEPEGWRRAWRQNLLAAQLTESYGREKVLEWYLNNADYGYLAHGIDEAAWVYFDKSAREVTLAEAAMLAAVSEAPTLNPIDTPQFAIERQQNVLLTMMVQGFLTADDAANANLAPIQVQGAASSPAVLAPDFVDFVMAQLDAHIGEARILRGGLEITTTLDVALQEQVECTAQVQTARLAGELPIGTLGGVDCPAASLLPRLREADVTTGAEIGGSVVVMDSSTSQVLTLVGDSAALHPPGTILSPFIYLTAFTRGVNPASLVWDIPASIPLTLEGYGNRDGVFHGPMRVRTALANDYLVPALATLTQVGPTNVWRTARQSGLYSLEIPDDEDAFRLILDRGAIGLVEVAHAFSMFSNQGLLAGQVFSGEETLRPTALLSVRGQDGRTWLDWSEPEEKAVASAQLAYLVTDILADEHARRHTLGHPNPLEIARPAAAKVGQTVSADNAWTVGYTNQRVVGVWLGFPQSEDGSVGESRQVSALAAAGLWHAVMKSAHENLDLLALQEPIGISRVVVCEPSGLLPTGDCPTTVTEVFLPGNEPVQSDNLYQAYQINSQTGRLATVYTPPEFVEDRVYLVVPPEAIDWAVDAGIEIPPTTYDVIFNPSTSDEFVAILTPDVFSYVAGEVVIGGRAWGEDFSYYRVQVGEGLNPRQWIKIGEDVAEPVEGGTLAEWDTAGLNGLYAIQLLLVKEDQSVSVATIQVTVDNTPPTVQITQPAEGQTFSFPLERTVNFLAKAEDNLGVAKVEFSVDGDSLPSLTEPPYAAAWQGLVGDHTLEVIATDLAGNKTETSVNFSIER